jgi:hypothetical protein
MSSVVIGLRGLRSTADLKFRALNSTTSQTRIEIYAQARLDKNDEEKNQSIEHVSDASDVLVFVRRLLMFVQ